jgi:hypothetical protein
VIVNLAGALFILGGISSVTSSLDVARRNPTAFLLLVAGATCLIAVGIGLLKRRNWARWLSLGISLTLCLSGSLALLWFAGRMLSAMSGGALAAMFGFIFLGVALLFGGGAIVLQFKLFEYLVSDAGRREFHVAEDESRAVPKSTALLIVCLATGFFLLRSSYDSARQFPISNPIGEEVGFQGELECHDDAGNVQTALEHCPAGTMSIVVPKRK